MGNLSAFPSWKTPARTRQADSNRPKLRAPYRHRAETRTENAHQFLAVLREKRKFALSTPFCLDSNLSIPDENHSHRRLAPRQRLSPPPSCGRTPPLFRLVARHHRNPTARRPHCERRHLRRTESLRRSTTTFLRFPHPSFGRTSRHEHCTHCRQPRFGRTPRSGGGIAAHAQYLCARHGVEGR